MARTPTDYAHEYLRQYEDSDFEPILVGVRRKQLLTSAARYPHRRILEVGCALEPLYPHLGGFETYTIVEASEQMSRRVAQDAAALPNVTVINATIEDAARDLGRDFDWIVCSSVVHEVPDPGAFLSAIHRVCDVHTVCHLSVPNAQSFHRLLAVEMGLIDRADELSGRDYRFGRSGVFNKTSLCELVTACGFKVIRDGTYFIKPFTHDQMGQLLGDGILPAAVVEGLYRISKHFPDNGCELFVEMRSDCSARSQSS